MFKKFPVQDLKCPVGLKEADFLDLLKSTFPQLADDAPFDLFITNRSRRLQPLKVKNVTPEEIHGAIRSTGNSALYIRLKVVPVCVPHSELVCCKSLPVLPLYTAMIQLGTNSFRQVGRKRRSSPPHWQMMTFLLTASRQRKAMMPNSSQGKNKIEKICIYLIDN